jgi:hypothetical protein
MMIHIRNKPRGKRPTEEGFMQVPLDWRKNRGAFWAT